jgi:LuxR family transcriptional regulator, quorum-sensing system regulator LasR
MCSGGHRMKSIERFASLLSYASVEAWRERIFQIGNDLGYKSTMLAIIPGRNVPVEAAAAFLQSNYSPRWRNKYDDEKMGHVDPTVSHCATKSIPLIWSPDIFSSPRQAELYEEACCYGLRSGVTLPMHGPNGELGMLCFVSDTRPDKNFMREATRNIPELSLFRDFILETSMQFMRHTVPAEQPVRLTPRELECLKWGATGKSSWEIGQILHCTEAAVNFHFSNIRRKFNTTTRNQAVIKAIHMGIIIPA